MNYEFSTKYFGFGKINEFSDTYLQLPFGSYNWCYLPAKVQFVNSVGVLNIFKTINPAANLRNHRTVSTTTYCVLLLVNSFKNFMHFDLA